MPAANQRQRRLLFSSQTWRQRVTLAELFADDGQPTEVNSTDKTLMEKVKLMESLEEEEKQTLFTMLDAFVSKKRLRDALSNALKMT